MTLLTALTVPVFAGLPRLDLLDPWTTPWDRWRDTLISGLDGTIELARYAEDDWRSFAAQLTQAPALHELILPGAVGYAGWRTWGAALIGALSTWGDA